MLFVCLCVSLYWEAGLHVFPIHPCFSDSLLICVKRRVPPMILLLLSEHYLSLVLTLSSFSCRPSLSVMKNYGATGG
jgi:hypothetical protein